MVVLFDWWLKMVDKDDVFMIVFMSLTIAISVLLGFLLKFIPFDSPLQVFVFNCFIICWILEFLREYSDEGVVNERERKNGDHIGCELL